MIVVCWVGGVSVKWLVGSCEVLGEYFGWFLESVWLRVVFLFFWLCICVNKLMFLFVFCIVLYLVVLRFCWGFGLKLMFYFICCLIRIL